jgi:hypothetical protein
MDKNKDKERILAENGSSGPRSLTEEEKKHYGAIISQALEDGKFHEVDVSCTTPDAKD